jgi:hypothetical protein
MKNSHSYTDNHDVDEDNVAISVYGGLWNLGNSAGVTYRYVFDSPSRIQPGNASGRRHLKMFIYYTDEHDVDENMMTIMNQSGMWLNGSMVGIVIRTMNDIPTSSPDYVASSNMQKYKIIRVRTMSTKTCGPSCITVESGMPDPGQVLHIDL